MDRAVVLGCAILVGMAVNGSAAEQEYEFNGFTKIKAARGVDVEVFVGEGFEVYTEASRERSHRRVRIEQVGDTLEIEGRKGHRFVWGLADLMLRGPDRVSVSVQMPELVSIETSSGADIEIEGVLRGDLTAKASSGSDIEIEGIDGGTVTMTASSGADISASGQCDALTAKASSGSDIKAEKMTCGAVAAKASSGADISVDAREQIIAQASSGADIKVFGNPAEQDVRNSSGGDVRLTH